MTAAFVFAIAGGFLAGYVVGGIRCAMKTMRETPSLEELRDG